MATDCRRSTEITLLKEPGAENVSNEKFSIVTRTAYTEAYLKAK